MQHRPRPRSPLRLPTPYSALDPVSLPRKRIRRQTYPPRPQLSVQLPPIHLHSSYPQLQQLPVLPAPYPLPHCLLQILIAAEQPHPFLMVPLPLPAIDSLDFLLPCHIPGQLLLKLCHRPHHHPHPLRHPLSSHLQGVPHRLQVDPPASSCFLPDELQQLPPLLLQLLPRPRRQHDHHLIPPAATLPRPGYILLPDHVRIRPPCPKRRYPRDPRHLPPLHHRSLPRP